MRIWWLAAVVVALGGCGSGDDGGPGSPASGAPPHPGEQTYMRFCFSCHASGIAGAPRVGDPEAWAPRLDKGRDALLQATIDGVPPGMPPRGLCAQCSEDDLDAAVDYMIERSTAANHDRP